VVKMFSPRSGERGVFGIGKPQNGNARGSSGYITTLVQDLAPLLISNMNCTITI
jgi:hypothetical protein